MPKYILSLLLILSVHLAFAQQGPSSVIDSVQPSCNGACNGYARVKITGGTPPYNLFWNTLPVQSATEAINLCPGTYKVTILDSNNLSTISNVTIVSDVVSVAVTHTNLSCTNYGVDTATVSASSLFGPFHYMWNSVSGTDTITVTNLPVGLNTVSATDSVKCTSIDTFRIQQPTTIHFTNTIHSTLCFDSSSGTVSVVTTGGATPYSYEWDNDSTLNTDTLYRAAAGIHVLTVKDSVGCIVNDTATVSQPTPVNIGINVFEPTCYGSGNGIIVVTPTGGTAPYYLDTSTTIIPTASTAIKFLYAGEHVVTITDSNHCKITDTVLLTQPTQLADSTTHTDLICGGAHNGLATVYPYGGTPPYHRSWSTTPPFGGDTVTGLSSGAYSITIADANNCLISDTVKVLAPPVLTISVTKTPDTGNCSGSAAATVTGGTGAYVYLWSNTATVPAITGLCFGTYTIQVTDSNNCIARDTITIQKETGVANVAGTNIVIAPNPFTQYIVVDWSHMGINTGTIRVTNVTGATVAVFATDGNIFRKIGTDTWPPGLYFISIADEEGHVVVRNVVKE